MKNNMRRGDYKGDGKLKAVIGKGGIKCYCCITSPKSIAKKLWNRLNRRRHAREILVEWTKILEQDTTESGGKNESI